MTSSRPRNLAASVQHRLKDLARQRREDFQFVLERYMLERFLYRLSRSQHRDRFALKGAMLFAAWVDQPHRPTRDLDLLGTGDCTVPVIEETIRELCRLPVKEDGVVLCEDTVSVKPIREQGAYGGVRVRLDATLGQARVRIQIDIGVGDAVPADMSEIEYPVLLDFPKPRLFGYRPETVVSEKFETMITLGIANSRMKDFHDVWFLAKGFEFDGITICKAITATFDRRGTALPDHEPFVFTAEFYEDAVKKRQWEAFQGKLGLGPDLRAFADVIAFLRGFLMPPVRAIVSNEVFNRRWCPGGPWQRSNQTG